VFYIYVNVVVLYELWLKKNTIWVWLD